MFQKLHAIYDLFVNPRHESWSYHVRTGQMRRFVGGVWEYRKPEVEEWQRARARLRR